MGVDKAELRLGGRTLLELAIEKLHPVSAEVVVVGNRVALPKGVRGIADRFEACGPLGGIEAALRDLGERLGEQEAEWAAFLPVDMPLLPAGLFQELVRDWLDRKTRPTVATVNADGRLQPLVSLVHQAVLPYTQRALAAGEFKVRPVLEQAAAELASGEANGRCGMERTELQVEELRGGFGGWRPTAAEWHARSQWFANLNTPEEFRVAREGERSPAGGTQ